MSPYNTTRFYALSVIPLFILMGMFLSHGELGRDVYKAVDTWMRHLRGGMAMATIGACAAFSAVSGSATATAATLGTVALPEMRRYKYQDSLAAACVAVGGTLGILIPPSTVLILYGILVEAPIGQLLIAGILPGILQAVLFMVTIYFQVKHNPSLAPPPPRGNHRREASLIKKSVAGAGYFFPGHGGYLFRRLHPHRSRGSRRLRGTYLLPGDETL